METNNICANFLSFFLILAISCNNIDGRKDSKIKIDSSFKNSLIERRVGSSTFYISIPPNYSIIEQASEDFSIYYIAVSDTSKKATFTCGMYFGNAPQEFEKSDANCKTEKMKQRILGSLETWTVFDCKGAFSIQTIIQSRSGEGWNEKIHAFGHTTSKTDLNRILEIYTTLKQKK